ncbi:transcription termination factor Rho [Citrobacter koseri]|uniref:Transcription termination factor Rho n=1 Tax=Citrobacter koseri TaxID=545 RepID=A0A2X2WI98_CITKO|nr:transcription termination factor Rho [Citrobacter koseri]
MGLENLARMRKQDIIFAILKQHAKSGEDIFGDGVLEILQDGFWFPPLCRQLLPRRS